MAELHYQHLTASLDRSVLVLTITERELQEEKLAAAVGEELLDAVAQFSARKVVIDMQRLNYMSSVAFRPLLRLRSKLRETGGRMILCGLTPVVGDIFYTTKMLNKSGVFEAPFQTEPDVAAAVERLNREVSDK
jgi:anti-anti-sigma factor